MGPKKGSTNEDTANSWRTYIEEALLDDEQWKVKVILIEAAGGDQDRIYLNKFEVFAAQERRFVIKNICKTETIFMVNQLGSEKKVKDESLRVFEEGQSYIKEKKEIPPDVLALIIKHLILKMKEEYLYIKRQRLQVRDGMRRESQTMVNRAEVRGTVSVKLSEPTPDLPKGKGKNEVPEEPELLDTDEGKKYSTLLRVRGEEWRDKVYVDDYPTDGPNLYVAITGFVEPYLAQNLIKIGIPLTAVIQVRIDTSAVTVPSGLLRATKRGQSQTELLMEKSLKFWDTVQELRIHKSSSEYYNNTAFIVFSPPYWGNEDLSGTPEKIYDELCYLMYDIQDLSRQHNHYIENMDIINIPEEDIDERYVNCYKRQIEDLPLECVTVYSLLDSMLQTVCKYFEENSSNTSLTIINVTDDAVNANDKIEKAERLVNDMFNVLCSSENKNKSYRLTYGEEYENLKNPTIINYGDIAKYNTFQLGNLNLHNIIRSMLIGMPINQLWNNYERINEELEAKINFHVNLLLSCFKRSDIETAELNRLIHILACRKLYDNRSSLKKTHLPESTITEFKKVYLKRSILAEPLSKSPSLHHNLSSITRLVPSIIKSTEDNIQSLQSDDESTSVRFLFQCPDISELISTAEISSGKPKDHFIREYEYFEEFSGINAFQIMLDSYNRYNCVDYKYCEVTDCLIMMFFNSHDEDGISRDEWRCHISTPLCLQDFFDFVLEEQYSWIQKEEKIYDANIMFKSCSLIKDLNEGLATHSCLENAEVHKELLMEGSLKHAEFTHVEEESSEEMVIQSTVLKKFKTPSLTDIESKASKRTKSVTGSTPRIKRQSMVSTSDRSEKNDVLRKPFVGYDLGNRRLEVYGKDSTYFAKDGTKIFSNYNLLIPINLENVSLRVKSGNENSEFWIHKVIGDQLNNKVIDACESFRIVSKGNLSIYVQKQTYEINLPILAITSEDEHKDNSIKLSNNCSTFKAALTDFVETQSFYSISVTWPNGLITETVHEKNSSKISHIKQFFITNPSGSEEEMRCISLNGEVIVFKTNGDIEVLRPDGSYIKITKCEKRVICTEHDDDFNSDTSSDKNKKGKSKEKGKPSKSSPKSSKKDPMSDNKEMEDIPPEYELVIHEFETIHTNGLREMWTNNTNTTIEQLIIRTATDYCLGEIFSRRMDGTHILLNKDGVQIVTFPNKTRIITKYFIEPEEIYPEWTGEELEYLAMLNAETMDIESVKSKNSVRSNVSESFDCEKAEDLNGDLPEKPRSDGYISVQIQITVEHPIYTTVTINRSNYDITIDSPNDTSISLTADHNYKFLLDNATKAEFNGKNLDITYESCPECLSKTTCMIKIKSDDLCSATKINRYWLRMEDCSGKKIIVNEEGNISIRNDIESSEEVIGVHETYHDDESTGSNNKCVEKKNVSSSVVQQKCKDIGKEDLRFFVLKRDLGCSELVSRAHVDSYKKECQWQPWCSINRYDTFGDNRSLLSMLTPIHRTETEKWLMESKYADKPTYLTYKDLKKDCGKGFYHWMRPYGRFQPKPRKPDPVLPNRLPLAYVFRTLEQQWKEKDREKLSGAKELLYAILKYRHAIEFDSEQILNIPIVDFRSEQHRKTENLIQTIAHRNYEELRMKLLEDVQSRAKASLTTKPLKIQEEISIEEEAEEEASEKPSEEGEQNIEEMDNVAEINTNQQRYLLREGSVPPYFRNLLGGAIWWEMNNAADEAATVAERRRMKCVCPAEQESESDKPLT
ncbi:unnamed protein product [Leptidea sinapis]|uniref:Sperm-associated antigen 17 n=1 Tax=Leptidea sinapis TaxID=189913 RepID=A0A5E4PML2_9NEOP|nr:unnamed protein product [Leptidea sinapis]